MPIAKEADNNAFVELLERSKKSLRILEIGSEDSNTDTRVGNQVWNFPNLVECKALPVNLMRSRCEMPTLKQDEGVDQQDHEEDSNSSPLKVLWVYYWSFPNDSELHILDNLVSLVIFGYANSSKWHTILENCSRTLKQLQIGLTASQEGEEEIFPLDFPQLQFLDQALLEINTEMFAAATILVSTIWIRFLAQLELLHTRFPYLVQLRFEPPPEGPVESQEQDDLLSAVRQRQSNVEGGMEVEGVKMLKLKTIVLPFKLIKPELLSEMRTLVDEVVDLATVLKR